MAPISVVIQRAIASHTKFSDVWEKRTKAAEVVRLPERSLDLSQILQVHLIWIRISDSSLSLYYVVEVGSCENEMVYNFIIVNYLYVRFISLACVCLLNE